MEKQLIRLETIPVIDYGGIEGISALVEKRIKALAIDKQVANEDTVKTLKTVRAELNKEFNDYEAQRKAIKEAISRPYTEFEQKYKTLIASQYQNADALLKEKVFSVEGKIKQEKEEKIKEYFTGYAKSAGIDFLTFNQVGVNVTMSASEKSLKEAVSTFVDDVAKDLDAIKVVPGDDDFRSDILFEYKRHLDVVTAIETASKRKREKEEMVAKSAQPIPQPEPEPQPQPEPEPEILQAPVVEDVREYTVQFEVTGTMDQLRAMKQYFIDNNLNFKSL